MQGPDTVSEGSVVHNLQRQDYRNISQPVRSGRFYFYEVKAINRHGHGVKLYIERAQRPDRGCEALTNLLARGVGRNLCGVVRVLPSFGGDDDRFSASIVRLAVLIAALSCPALPADASPASDRIGKLNTTFTAVMQNAKALGYEGRYEKLKPAIIEAYDFSEMARVTTGRYWSSFTDDQKRQVVAAFRDLSIATYAARFDGSGSERFQILGEEPAPAGHLRVNNQAVPASGEPIRIDYLLRQDGGQWRIIDVYLKSSVSELAVRRDEFSKILAKSGFDGLIADLKAKAAKLRSQGPTASN
jgi:phospholipid transport system substrate-binding protein